LVQGHTNTPPYAVVRVSPFARDAYRALVADTVMPPATLVVMEHRSLDGSRRGPFYVMEKGNERWSYEVVEVDGTLGKADDAACSGCHALAVADSLFGPPRPKAGAPSTPGE
jgi:hypothetical protein